MEPIIVDIPGVGPVEFPATMSQDEINAASKKLHDETNQSTLGKPDNGFNAAAGAAAVVVPSALKYGVHKAGDIAKNVFGINPNIAAPTTAPSIEVQKQFVSPEAVQQRIMNSAKPARPAGPSDVVNWAMGKTEGAGQYGRGYLGGANMEQEAALHKSADALEAANRGHKIMPGTTNLLIPEEEANRIAKQRADAENKAHAEATARAKDAAELRKQRLAKLEPTTASKLTQGALNVAGKPAFNRFTTGYNTSDLLQAQNPFEAGVSAAGAVSPYVAPQIAKILPPKYRNRVEAVGKAIQYGAPAVNFLERQLIGPEEHAAGGAIQHFAGLKSGAVKLAAKMSPGIEESLGKILPKSKPLTLAEKFGYDPVKLRNEYPQTSFPVSAWDKNKEAYYAAKNPSSEELALKAARDFAQEEIKSGSSAYKPYFDISKRGYVDPSNYPLPGPQTTSIIPKQQKTIDAYTAKFQNPEAIQKWSDAYELAKNSPNAHHFYAMDQLEKEYVKAYGPELGRHKFKTEFADQMANTTSGVTPTNNLLTAAYVNHMNASGLPLPGHALGEYSGYSFDAPHPVQGGRIGANLAQSNKYAEAGNQLNPLENPKRYDFSGNFMGHQGLTMDEQMMTPFGMAAPPKGSYGLAELEGAKQAALKGVTVPSDWQSVTWAGLKALKDSKGKELSPDELSKIGQPMIEDVNQAIHRTSRVLNISPKEALDQLLKNKPVYGVGAIGAGASQNEEPQTKKAGGKIDFLAFKIKQNIKKK